jgi:hypothetical protein
MYVGVKSNEKRRIKVALANEMHAWDGHTFKAMLLEERVAVVRRLLKMDMVQGIKKEERKKCQSEVQNKMPAHEKIGV